MDDTNKILEFIDLFKSNELEVTDRIIDRFTKGDCARFCLILHTTFPNSQPIIYKRPDGTFHWTLKIENVYYDITGRLSLNLKDTWYEKGDVTFLKNYINFAPHYRNT